MTDPEVARLLAVPALTTDTDRALALVRARARSCALVRARAAGPSLRRMPVRWLQGLAAAAVVLVASTLTLTGFAGSLLTIFEPQKFVAIPIDPNDLRIAGGLERYGALAGGGVPLKPTEVVNGAAARAASGFTAAVPGTLPAGVGAQRWAVLAETSATFTFSASAARGAAAAAGRTAPPMPAGMDGSRLVLTTGAAVLQTWAGAQAGGGAAAGGGPGKAAPPELPTLVIAQLRAPTIASDGVTVNELQAYLLAQPGISPALAAQIRAIADPAHTLPVPVPAQASTKNVKVQGTDGLFVGDSTGLGSGVVWRKGEYVFGVAGTLTEAQLLAVANSLR